jgi:hypothetical protein
MKMDGDDLKFSPQVMALAMPDESGFTKAAQGIGNLGKVFLEADKRKEESALNTLKMEEANQSIIGKSNENSVFQENNDIKQNTFRQEQTKRAAEITGLNFKNEKDIKDLQESGLKDTLRGMLPKEAYMNADSTPDKTVIANTRAAFLEAPEWKDRGHIVNSVFDSLETDIFKGAKTAADLKETAASTADKEATTAGQVIKNQYEPQVILTGMAKDKASTAASLGAANNSNASAAQTKAEIPFIKEKVQQGRDAITVSQDNSKTTAASERRQLATFIAKQIENPEFGKNIDGYDQLDANEKAAYKQELGTTLKYPKLEFVPAKNWYGSEYKDYRIKKGLDKPAPTKGSSNAQELLRLQELAKKK